MGKFKFRKLCAATLAAVLAATAAPRIELGTEKLANAVQSVLDFQQQVAAMQSPKTDAEPFVSLRYDAEQGMLYRDGKPVGDRCGEYAVVDGTVMLSAKAAGVTESEKGYVSLAQAAEEVGCTVTEDENGVTVTSPFDSAALIVKSDAEIEKYGAIDCVENRDGIYVLQYATPADAYKAYQKYMADESVDFAEPSRTVSLAAVGAEEKAYSYIMDENTDWGVEAIGAEAYNKNLIANNETLPEIVVAVVDTGIYFEHERFENRIVGRGAAFLDKTTYTVDDENGHGTHCAGIIVGATTDNVKILPVRVLDEEGYGSIVAIYCGMLYAMEQGADVVSMSLGISGESPLVQYTVGQLYDAGVVCCVAAGNETMDADNVTPARAEQAITVGAVDQYNGLAYFSNYGPLVDVVAPGVDVWSAGIESPDEFVHMSGTSMATPYVAACSAMVLSGDENLTVDEVDSFLKANAIDLGASGRDDEFGYGLVYMGSFVFDDTYCEAPIVGSFTDETTGETVVTISCVTEGAEIYYTLDGTLPTKDNALLYHEPFAVNASVKVTAVSYLGEVLGGYCELAVLINGKDIENAVVVKDGVLVAYNGVLTDLDLTARDDITAVGADAFAGNTTIESVKFADTVLSIGDRAFANCPELWNMEAYCVTSVGEAAFRNSGIRWVDTASLTEVGEAAFENCFLLYRIYLSEELTVIPARLLKNTKYDNQLNLPNVTFIGDEAFSGCIYADFSSINWGAMISVGKEAFRGCHMQGVYADFEALEFIGEGAFRECYNLSGIILPETITEIPAYLLEYVSWLDYLIAPGVTTVGDYGLALTSGFSVVTEVDIPFAQITKVGECAFKGFYFPEPADFALLTEAGREAFNSANGAELSFPVLETIPVGAFGSTENPVLYFESATTVERDAFVSSVSIAVFSDKCTEIAADAFVNASIAAPVESVAAEYALANDAVNYYETPSLYAPQTDYIFDLMDTQAIEGYGLGFGMQYQWYDAAGNPIAYATESVYYPAVKPGTTESLTLNVIDADGNDAGAVTYTVTVNQVEFTADLKADEVILCDYDALMAEWDAAVAADDYEFDFCTYRYYSFTPETDGTYYFHLSDYYNSAELVLYGTSCETDTYKTTKFIEAMLSAGETYTLIIRYTNNEFAGALGVSTKAPTEYYSMDGCWWDNSEDFSDGVIAEEYPYVPELQLFNPNFGSAGLLLSEGDDLLLMMTNNDAPGRMSVYAFGQGRFMGAADELHIILLQTIEEDEPLMIIPKPGEQGVQFIPTEDGLYSILTAHPMDYLAGFSESEIADAITDADPYFYIDGDDVYEYVDDYEGGPSYTRFPAVTVNLTAGTKYTIGACSYGDAPYELYITRVKQNMLDCEMICDGWNDTTVITLYNASGEEMTEGVDYQLYTFASDYGDIYTVAQGIGDYYGTLYKNTGYKEVVSVEGIPQPCVDIALDVPFAYDPDAACYRFVIEEECAVHLQLADDGYAMFHVFVVDENGQVCNYFTYCDSTFMLSIEPGEYIIEFLTEESNLTDELCLCSVIDICDVNCYLDDMMYTGDVLLAQPEIYYGDALLVEGVDYELGGDVSVVECGNYVIDVYGIGRFGGRASFGYNVFPDLSMATESLTDGENVIGITRPGGTALYQWIPENTGSYAIACLDVLDVSVNLLNADGVLVGEMKGYDEVYTFVDVTAGETYYVSASLSAKDMADSFTLLLDDSKHDLSWCVADTADVYYVTGEPVMPKPEVKTAAGSLLKEGVDYEIVTYGANLKAGIGVVELKGKGDYIGRLTIYFDIYLDNLYQLETIEEDAVEAVIYEGYNFAPGDMDETLLLRFTNTTEDNEVFSVTLNDSDGISVLQAYDAAGIPILDFNPDSFTLPVGETIYLYLVTNRVWWYEIGEASLVIGIGGSMTVEHNGLYYAVDGDGNATLTGIAGDRFTYEVVESFEYNGDVITVVGVDSDALMGSLLWNQQVFYVPSTDDGIGQELGWLGYVAVSLANISDLKGDADGDGMLDYADLILLNGYICETAVIAEENLANCDMNADGCIDYNDMVLICADF